MKNKIALKYIIILIILLVAGCGGKNKTITLPTTPIDYKQGQEAYVLQPGDNIDIKFYYNPELNENVTIRPDGKISLQLIDELQAAGLTPTQLDDTLTKAYSKQLKQPVVAVILRTFEGQKIYVGGEVHTPMVLNLPGKINALQAIINAGSFTKDAKISSVIIMSRGPDNRPIARKVNLKKALNGEMPEEEYLLKPFDIIYVPKTELASADEFMTHIYKLIPPNIHFGFSYELHNAPDNYKVKSNNEITNQGYTYKIGQ